MDTTFLTATVIVQDISILAAIIVFALTPKAGRKEFLWLGLALLIGFLTDAISFFRFFILDLSSNSLISVGSLMATVFYLLFYKSQFKSKNIQALVIGVIVLDISFLLINMLFIQGVSSITSYSFIIRSIAFIVISLLYFYQLIRELPTQSITKLPMFWINTSFLLYYAGTFFQWLVLDYIINVLKGDVVNTYTIKNGLGILHYLLIAVGLWYNRSLYLSKPDPA